MCPYTSTTIFKLSESEWVKLSRYFHWSQLKNEHIDHEIIVEQIGLEIELRALTWRTVSSVGETPSAFILKILTFR